LELLSEVQKKAALCALGQGASNPLLTTLEHFRDEYEAHIIEKRCPGGVCKALTATSSVASA
jgi:NADH:ubiquinone oxidoreductase subunit F (NADH-binding)